MDPMSACQGAAGAMQAMLNSGAIKEFHLNDEEILVRHLHKVVQDYVANAEANKEQQ